MMDESVIYLLILLLGLGIGLIIGRLLAKMNASKEFTAFQREQSRLEERINQLYQNNQQNVFLDYRC